MAQWAFCALEIPLLFLLMIWGNFPNKWVIFIIFFKQMISLGTEGEDECVFGPSGEALELVSDQLYHKSYQYFRICNQVVLLFSLATIAAIPFYVLQYQLSHVTIFLIVLLLESVLQLMSFYFLYSASGKTSLYYRIAEALGHAEYQPRKTNSDSSTSAIRISQVYDYLHSQMEEDQRKMKSLSIEIKECLLRLDKTLATMNRAQLAVYQVVHAWGILLLLFIEFPDKQLQSFVLIVIVTGTYQYIEIYMLAAFATLAMPLNAAQYVLQYLKSKYKSFKVRRKLNSHPFSLLIKGDHQCKICLMDYQLNQKITVLSCNELHNFHNECLREWTKNATTCPLCRKDIC